MTTPNTTGAVTALHDELCALSGCTEMCEQHRRWAERLASLAVSPPEDAPAVDGGDAVRDLLDAMPALGDPTDTGHSLLFEFVTTREEHAAYLAALARAEALAAAPVPAVEREADPINATYPKRRLACGCVMQGATRWIDCTLHPEPLALHSHTTTPPAEAREPVGVTDAMVERGVAALVEVNFEAWEDGVRRCLEAALCEDCAHNPGLCAKHDGVDESAALAQPQATPRDSGDAARYFVSGPEGHFYTDSHTFAETLLQAAGRDRDDWTITDLQSPAGEPT